MVSVCGVVVATIALVCALSVYNGFNDLVSSLFSNFDPELKIMPRKGKVFDPTSEEIRKVRELPGIVCFSEVLQCLGPLSRSSWCSYLERCRRAI